MALFKNKKTANQRRSTSNQGRSAVFSYYTGRVTPQNRPRRHALDPRAGAKAVVADRKMPLWQFLPSLLAMLAIFGGLLYTLTLQTTPRLSHSTQQEDSLLQEDKVYTRALEKHLKNSIFNRSKLLINAPAIEEKLEQEFPELASATITIPLTSRRPILSIEPIIPFMVINASGGDFVLNSDGKTVLGATQGRSEILAALPAVKDDSGLRIKLGETALSRGQTQFIREIDHQLSEKAIQVENMTLPAIPNELHVRIAGEGYYIKFNTSGDARLQAGTYLALRERLDGENKKPSEYIDVRIEEKAFYK